VKSGDSSGCIIVDKHYIFMTLAREKSCHGEGRVSNSQIIIIIIIWDSGKARSRSTKVLHSKVAMSHIQDEHFIKKKA
jgi:hypothetical protein